MKRWMWILGALLLLMGGTAEDRRLENLRPVQLLYITRPEGSIRVETDLGDRGEGSKLEYAMACLRETAPGVVLTETTEMVIIDAREKDLCAEAAKLLRPSTEVLLGTGNIDPEKASEYLRSRSSGVTLRQIRTGETEIPVLKEEGGQYEIREWGSDG